MNERALELCRRQRRAARARQPPHRRAGRRCPPTSSVDELWSNPPIRIGKAALHDLLGTLARSARPRRAGRCSSCRSTSAPTRSTAGSRTEGYAVDRLRSRAGYRLLEVRRREAARRHRHEAAPPRLAPPHGRHGSPSSSTTCRARSTSAPSSAPRPRCRVDDAWLAGRTPAPDDPKVGKTALGTDRYLTFHRVDTADRRDRCGPLGRATASSASSWPTAPARCTSSTPSDATCIVVGHEDRGCSPATLDACDEVAYLPQLGRVGSLNVATAASIALYELRRREWSATAGLRTPDAPGGIADLASPPWWIPTYGALRDDELVDAARIVNRAMLGSVTDEVNEGWASLIDAERTAGRVLPEPVSWSGFTRDFDADLSVPGGADVPAAGVTAVGVLVPPSPPGPPHPPHGGAAPRHGRPRHRRRAPRRRRVADLRPLRVRPGHRRLRVRHRHPHRSVHRRAHPARSRS